MEKKVEIPNIHKSYRKQIVGAAACIAVVFVGVFALIVNIGKLNIAKNPESSSGIILSGNSNNAPTDTHDVYGLNTDKNMSGGITVNYAYGYENNSDKPTRYEIGDKFGSEAEIISAKSTFLITDGKPVLLKQELTLAVDYEVSAENAATDKCLTGLDIPDFGEGFQVIPLISYFPILTSDSNTAEILYRIKTLDIIVDCGKKTITPQPGDDTVFKGIIFNEKQGG